MEAESSRRDWREAQEGEDEAGPRRSWTGITEFKLKEKCKVQDVAEVLMMKRGGGEIFEDEIKPEEWPLWREADASEWNKVLATNAVKVLSSEESKDVQS